MYRRILFAVDRGQAASEAVPVVAAFGRAGSGDVRVLHVRRVGAGSAAGAGGRLVEDVVRRLRKAGVDADGEIRLVRRDGDVAGAVAAVAVDGEADLVVLGSRGPSDVAALFRRSVGFDASARLDVPTLVLRPSRQGRAAPTRVLVAVDGSPMSERAVAEAAEVATAFRSEVLVVHVRQVIPVEATAVVEPEDEARAILDRAVAGLRLRGIEAGASLVTATDVASAVAEASERFDADLVVIGSRRPSSLGALLLGSVGHQLVHALRRPVLLARRSRVAAAVR
jgi:nucleotide-binding universal stress UspA family protein